MSQKTLVVLVIRLQKAVVIAVQGLADGARAGNASRAVDYHWHGIVADKIQDSLCIGFGKLCVFLLSPLDDIVEDQAQQIRGGEDILRERRFRVVAIGAHDGDDTMRRQYFLLRWCSFDALEKTAGLDVNYHNTLYLQ